MSYIGEKGDRGKPTRSLKFVWFCLLRFCEPTARPSVEVAAVAAAHACLGCLMCGLTFAGLLSDFYTTSS